MTRRSLLILIAILVSAFTFSSASSVGACELDALDHFVQMEATDAITMYSAAIAPVPLVSADSGASVPQQ
jgi:hypothetical protein